MRSRLVRFSVALGTGSAFAHALRANAEVVVAPSMLHVASVAATLRKDVAVAGQNACVPALCISQPACALTQAPYSLRRCRWHGPCGAFTGEVAAEQLRDAGANWVLLGHSERRAFSHESDDYVSTKVRHAQDAGLAVLACVGETLAERTAGATLAVVDAQMRAIAEHVASWGERLVIAYEPVWAIGTGLVATPAQVQEVHAELRRWLRESVGPEAAARTRLIYGGSVAPASAHQLARLCDVDGFLVGGASLKKDFLDIIDAARDHVHACEALTPLHATVVDGAGVGCGG
jgi:triosephosphate isomerase